MLASACASEPPPKDPQSTLQDYARALQEQRVDDAYAMLSDEAKKNLPFDAFRRMVTENPGEVLEIAEALGRPAGDPVVTATVTAPSGETILLVYEKGKWRVDGSSIDLYSQVTPKRAIESFVRAYENRRYDILIRFVPSRDTEGLDSAKLKKAFEGEQKEEMQRLTQALKAALPTARIELLGDRATMAYGAGGTVELLREHGAWKVEDIAE